MLKLRRAVTVPVALAAVLCMSPAVLVGQSKPVSDAQVEADVMKGFAADPRVGRQQISTSTVYGVVTLSGSVETDAARDAAEQVASHTPGVKKVIDQLTVGVSPTTNPDPAAANTMPGMAGPQNSGGAYGISTPPPDSDYSGTGAGQNGSTQQPYAQPYPGQGSNYPQGTNDQQVDAYPQGIRQPQPGPPNAGAYPDGTGAYPPPPPRRLYRRDYERQMAGRQQGGYAQGQQGGLVVTIPDGTVLPVAVNRWLSSGNAQPGAGFTALVTNDVLAGGQIAIPRGATVEGTVLDAKGAGVLKGRGVLTLQLNTLDLGGQRIPLQSDPFTVAGRDKAARSVTSTVLGAGLGALFGAAIGRGTGAAIGAGVGGAAGLGTAAASNSGQATLRPEEMLRFRLTAPLQVTTVSEAEMQRLGGYAGPAGQGGPGPYGYSPYADAAPYPYAYPVTVGVYGAPYPYRYYRRGFYRGYWY